MNAKSTTSVQHSILRVALGTALILLIPLVAMQFSDGMNWDETDFIVVGALVFGTGMAFELLRRAAPRHRLLIGVALLAMFLWLYVELAVGLFTDWGS